MSTTYFTKFFRKERFLLFCYLFVFVANFWSYRIGKENFLLLFFLFLLGFGYIFFEKFLIKKVLFLIIVVYAICLSIISFHYFDNRLFIARGEEISLYGQRHNYYANAFGALFENKISLLFYSKLQLPVSKYIDNLAYGIDPNVYFFAGHPREQQGVDEFEKFPFLFLPFFLIGAYLLIRKIERVFLLFIVTSILLSGFITPFNPIGPILFFPIICCLIAKGLFFSVHIFMHWRKKYV